jgi:hypothetical protein
MKTGLGKDRRSANFLLRDECLVFCWEPQGAGVQAQFSARTPAELLDSGLEAMASLAQRRQGAGLSPRPLQLAVSGEGYPAWRVLASGVPHLPSSAGDWLDEMAEGIFAEALEVGAPRVGTEAQGDLPF